MGLADRLRFVRHQGPLGELFDRLAAVHGDRRVVEQPQAISCTGGRSTLTFAEAAAVVGHLSGELAGTVEPGRPVVVRGANDYGFFLACLAASRAGAVVVPVNPRMRDEEVAYVVEDAGGDVLDLETLPDVGVVGPVPPPREPPGDTAAILYTSGTTGRPKGAKLSHHALVDPASLGVLWPNRARRDEVVVSLPIAHIMGFAALVGVAGTGVALYFMPRFSPVGVLDAIERRRATAFIGVPAMYRMMLEAGAEARDLTSIRVWISGADVMPPDLAERFKKLGASATLPVVQRPVGEAAFAQGYGMVELGGAVSGKLSPPGTSLGLGDVLGMSLFGSRMRVVDEDGDDVPRGEIGELLVRSPAALSGYQGDPDRSTEVLVDGWVRTGDLARRGRLGLVHFAGRKKDVLMRGGYSVFPMEIEAKLLEIEGVAEAAVVGRPDRVQGEVPVAFVRVEPGAELTPEGILASVSERVADYKRPVEVRLVAELPKTGTGKISKAELREELTGDGGADAG